MKHINCKGLNGEGVIHKIVETCGDKEMEFTLKLQSNFNDVGLVLSNYFNDYSYKSSKSYDQTFAIPFNIYVIAQLIDYLIQCMRQDFRLTVCIVGPKRSIKQFTFWLSDMPSA